MNFEETHALLNQTLAKLSENQAQRHALMKAKQSLKDRLIDLSPIPLGTRVNYSIPPRKGQNKELLEGTAFVTGIAGHEPFDRDECNLRFTLGEPVFTKNGKQAIRNGKPRYEDLYLGDVYLEHLTKVEP